MNPDDLAGMPARQLREAATLLDTAAAANRHLAEAYKRDATAMAALVKHLAPFGFDTTTARQTAQASRRAAKTAERLADNMAKTAELTRRAAEEAPGADQLPPAPLPPPTAADLLREAADSHQAAARRHRNLAEAYGDDRAAEEAHRRIAHDHAQHARALRHIADHQHLPHPAAGRDFPESETLKPGRPANHLPVWRFAAVMGDGGQQPPRNEEELNEHLDNGGKACQWIIAGINRKQAHQTLVRAEVAIQAAGEHGQAFGEGKQRQ